MADGPSPPKRNKTEVKRMFYDFFLEKKDLCYQLKTIVDLLLHGTGISPPNVCPMKIEIADASMCKSFSNAHCSLQFHYDRESVPFVIAFGQLFVKGCTILLAFLTEKLVPENQQELKILERLITYLSQPNPKALFEDETDGGKETERNWCIKMAQHLLSQLSHSKEYIIDNKYEGGSTKVCPCQDKDELFGTFGDTSFGCKTLWHGSADLLLGMPLQCVSPGHISDTDTESEGSVTVDSSSIRIEAKGGDDFSQRDKFQMRAQVIGFSFLTHKIEREKNKEKAKYFLIPHIGFSKDKICYRFYDSVNDILLEMKPIEMYEYAGKFKSYVVLLTWLVLNYKVLGGETPACLLGYKSGFHDMFPTQLDKYKEETEHPCHIKQSLQKEERFPFNIRINTYDYEESKKQIKFKSLLDL